VVRELSASVDQRYWLLRELQERLERAALSDAIVIGIDDIQWGRRRYPQRDHDPAPAAGVAEPAVCQ
jgi:hypothetical protein